MRPAIEQLQRAFENGEFVLHYQPILRLSDGHMVAAEALLRWNHPSEGLIAPRLFLPLLEESGLIVEIGCWAVREAVRQVGSWRVLYGRDIAEWVGVNLSPQQLDDPASFVATLRGGYDAGAMVSRLRLEIGEAALLHRPGLAATLFPGLTPLGVGVVVDAFDAAPLGPPIAAVKIDAAPAARGAASARERVAQRLRAAAAGGVEIIARGIETTAQCEAMRALGCGLGQGYLFADPMDGALLGTFALSRAVGGWRATRRAVTPPTSADRSQAG